LNSYSFHITLYGLAFLGAIFIGLTFALLLWFTNNINRSANRFLALALFTMILWMGRLLAIDVKLETYLPQWDKLPMQFLLALGPLMYFYVLKITRPSNKFSWRDSLHFTPLLLEQAALILEIKESNQTGAATYATRIFQQLNPVLQLLIFISVITYLYKSHKQINNFYRRLQPVLMDRSLLEFRWLRRLLGATTLLWCVWIVFAAIGYFDHHAQLGAQGYYPFYIFFAVIIIWTAMAAFLKPQAAVMVQTPAPVKVPVPVELREKGARLKGVMDASLYYEDPELSLSSLAEKLNLPPHELSRVINTVFKKSFNDFINEYRVRAVVTKMQDPAYDNITLLGIAFEAGFNSKATFNRTFKQITGQSPAEFKNNAENKASSYHLRRLPGSAAVISNHQATPKWADVKLNRNIMFRNYVKIAWRNIYRHKTFSLINIFGLGLGLACSLLIMLWVYDEYSEDAFHKNGAQLYGVFERRYNDGAIEAGFATQSLMPDELKRIYPEVQYATGLAINGPRTFEAGDKILKENGNCAGPDFFTMFTYPLLKGDVATALQSPVGIAISKKMAADFFGSPAEAMGKTIRYENKTGLQVTAVFDDVPKNSSVQFDYVLNWPAFLADNEWAKNWTNNGTPTFIMLRRDADPALVEKKMARFLDTYNKEQTATNYVRLGIQRYGDMYLHSNFKDGELSGGRVQYAEIFSIVAIFILLIACINFMNLTTARSLERAKEIGVRKVVGAVRSSLIKQFIGEALLIVTIAVFFALIIVALMLPQFNLLTQKQIALPFTQRWFWLTIAGLILVTGFISGSYPALYLSGFSPLRVLKGSLKFTSGALWFRKGLVIFQFALSIMLIIGTMIISEQVDYIQSSNLGYNRENLVYIHFEGDLADKYVLFKQEALRTPGIKEISCITQDPTRINNGTTGINWEGKNPDAKIEFTHAGVGYDLVNTMHIQMASGREFSKNFATDSAGYIINETGAKIIGYKDPVGKPLTLWKKKGTIIGVVKDFHFSSLHESITPMVLYFGENAGWGTALVRIEAGKTKQAMEGLEKICKNLNPKFPFTYKFSDEEYAKLYSNEQVVGQLSNYFAFLAIFISCLGLLGLVMFTAQQRTKEFGIRKVLGASAGSLFSLLSKEFLQLVLVAILIASPIAWFFMNSWLQDYVYRISISWTVFMLAGVLAICIALITVSFQAIKTAMANPVRSLRSE